MQHRERSILIGAAVHGRCRVVGVMTDMHRQLSSVFSYWPASSSSSSSSKSSSLGYLFEITPLLWTTSHYRKAKQCELLRISPGVCTLMLRPQKVHLMPKFKRNEGGESGREGGTRAVENEESSSVPRSRDLLSRLSSFFWVRVAKLDYFFSPLAEC